MASSLNVKIKVLLFLNILFAIVCIYLAFNTVHVYRLKSNSGGYFLLIMFLASFHIIMTIPIMCSTTICGNPIPQEYRLMMLCFCYLCFMCLGMAEDARKGKNKFVSIIILIVVDLLGFILYLVFFYDIFILESLISFSLINLINIIFCALRKKMELFEDYDDNKVIESELNQNSNVTPIANEQI